MYLWPWFIPCLREMRSYFLIHIINMLILDFCWFFSTCMIWIKLNFFTLATNHVLLNSHHLILGVTHPRPPALANRSFPQLPISQRNASPPATNKSVYFIKFPSGDGMQPVVSCLTREDHQTTRFHRNMPDFTLWIFKSHSSFTIERN